MIINNNSMKSKILLLLFFIGILNLSAQKESDDVLRERIYMQTDKQIYLAGELLWLKAVTTTNEGKPLKLSKIAYIELLDEASSLNQIKINIHNGVGEGWMVLPSSLSTGYYRLTAYSAYMRNEGTDVLFEKNIGVINLQEANETTVNNTAESSSIQNNLQNNTFDLSSDKAIYTQRDSVKISMAGLPDDIYNLSISIAGEEPVAVEGTINIRDWKDGLSTASKFSFQGNYIPEYEGHIVNAKLIDLESEKPTFNQSVTPFISFSGDQMRLFSGQQDSEGNIRFYTKRIDGMKELVSTLSNFSGKKYRVDIQSPFISDHRKEKLPVFDINTIDKDYLSDRSVALQALYAYANDSINQFNIADSYFMAKPDRVYLMDEYTRFATMQEVITEFVTFVRFRNIYGKRFLSVFKENVGYSSGNTLVMIDGIPIFDHDIVFKYNPLYIKQIETYHNRYVFGGQMFDGIVSFTTYRHDYPELELDESTQFFDYQGTQAYRPFHIPTYETEAKRKSRLPDFRHTLYWNPDVQIKGESEFSTTVYTSDLRGKYKITAEGLTKEGRVIYATSSFIVE